MSPRALPKFPSLSRQDGTLAATFEEKVERLRETHFPAPLGADLEDIAEVEYLSPMPGGGDLTEAEVYSSIKRPSQDKAPGINGILNRFLRAVYSELEEEIRHLFQGCFEIRYHPRKFKEVNTVILKKPQKENYADPKSYRPIALLDTLGKIFETVIAARLRDCAEANNLLPEEQMGARQGRSVETALETITDAVHTVWGMGKRNVASLLSLDVAGAFDHVSHSRLLHTMKMKRVPERIVRWTASFLTERATSITLGRRTSQMELVETGIP